MQEYVKGNPIFTNINNTDTQYKYLTKNIETDVLVVGGGVTGAICAYYLTKNNINTTSKRLAYHSQSFLLSSISIFIESSEMLPDFHAVPAKLCVNRAAADCNRYRDPLLISDLLEFRPHKAEFHSPSISSADIFHLISHKIILASTFVQNHL